MTLRKTFKDFQVDIFDDTLYDPMSADNIRQYNKLYSDKEYGDYFYLTRHGIQIFKDEELINSTCLVSGGGTTGIHETGLLIDNNKLLICCGNSIFCLTLPDLELDWRTKADDATCFEIFKYKDAYIVHGELEISRVDKSGQIVWEFSGSDIFTTPNGKDTFEIRDGKVIAINWEGIVYELDINDGKVLDFKFSHQA
jgi:outer membrane protein assembly factor BamB